MAGHPHAVTRRQGLALLAGAGALTAPAWAQLKTGDNPDTSPRWLQVRNSVFAGRDIADDGDAVLRLDVPKRAADAGQMPLALRAQFDQSAARHIQRVWLVIDHNPSPVGALFSFTRDSGRAEIETRVRVDEYSHVRAISETSDGRLHASTRFVKASGGCSAPPGSDAAAAQAMLGRMQLRVLTERPVPGQPALAQLAISHPNDSGFAMDQLTRQFTPPHFVRRIEVQYAGAPVFSAEVDFSISENPNLRFWFVPRAAGDLKVLVVDSKDLQFTHTLAFRPDGA
jgi:sulfur-oxidizing protein SoxY